MVPNIIHFIFGLKEDFGGKPFSFIHYLAIKSAYETNKPDQIKFHYCYEPSGPWWEQSKLYLTLVKIDPPREIFGNPLMHVAHQTDVLRLEILMREGGIYLDIDVLTLNSYGPLRQYDCVMGMEENVGLCNAVIIAKPNSTFLKIWYQEYKNFRSKGKDKYWGEHAVIVPLRLAKENPRLIHIEDKYAFFWPNYVHGPITTLWNRPSMNLFDSLLLKIKQYFALKFISTSYCVHLWEQLWWEDHLKEMSLDYINSHNDNFSVLVRTVLSRQSRPLRQHWGFFRPIMKKLIHWYLPGLTTAP